MEPIADDAQIDDAVMRPLMRKHSYMIHSGQDWGNSPGNLRLPLYSGAFDSS